MPAVELLQALLQVWHPVDLSSGEAKFMLRFHTLDRLKIHTANELGCTQITSLFLVLDLTSGEKKIVLTERPSEKILRRVSFNLFAWFRELVETVDYTESKGRAWAVTQSSFLLCFYSEMRQFFTWQKIGAQLLMASSSTGGQHLCDW